MTQSSSQWQITLDAGHDRAYAILARDPVWNAFALADLEPPLRTFSQFTVASQKDSHQDALCLVLRHPVIGHVLSPFGSEEGVAAILAHIALPEHPLIQAQEVHMPVLQRWYRPQTTWRGQLRMAVTGASWRPPLSTPARGVQRLAPADVPALTELYQQNSESAFSADLYPGAVFFGVYDGDHLIAAGGTHALVPAHRIAVLGNIFTAPPARGQGYATAITAALVATLLEQDISPVVLNVFEDNRTAIHVYQQLGFLTHHRLLTGTAIRDA
jgi:RimJ/RimL family protein N-acetyltransferase